MAKNFGRDDMNALLGGGAVDEMAAFRPTIAQPRRDNKSSTLTNRDEPDLASMTAAEAAALLMQKSAGKGPSSSATSSRYRTKRVLAHHALAQELSEKMLVHIPKAKPETRSASPTLAANGGEEDGNASVEDFVAKRKAAKRDRVTPQVVQRRSRGEKQQKRRVCDSSSSSSSSFESDCSQQRLRGRRKSRQGNSHDNSSSSSSDDEADQRRQQRLQARRKHQEPQVIMPKLKPPKEELSQPDSVPIEIVTGSVKTTAPIPKQHQLRSSESSGTDSTSDDSSSEDSSSDSSSDEDEQVNAKPVFLPKHKRNLVQSEEKKWEEEEARLEREKQRTEKRKMESRAMVAKTVTSVQISTNDDEVGDEAGGATNAPPDDDDEVDPEKERDAWELREVERLLTAMDAQKKREKEQLEYERRRQMTDEECLQEDVKAGRYRAPGSNRQGGTTGNFMQRFYHRGAYYMDKEEWDEADVRHKAAEYAKAATGEDKIDKKALPEVMQVKKFGFARQNTKYKGLASEDTTDNTMKALPLINKHKK